MQRVRLLVFSQQEFETFYQKYSKDYTIIPISSLLNRTVQLETIELDDDKNYIIDITALVKSAISRDDLLLFYETWINQLIENNSDIQFAVEETVKSGALNIFSNYFYNDKEDNVCQVNSKGTQEKVMRTRKDIVIYRKEVFDQYSEARKRDNITVLSISEVLNKRNAIEFTLDLSIIDKDKFYEIDISSMISQFRMRSDLIMSCEIFLFELSRNDKVSFSLESEKVDECKDIFRHVFQNYHEISLSSQQIKAPISIVSFDGAQLDELMESFNKQLFGHEEFKKDLKLQLKAFTILNRMGRNKIFSMFLCGSSGIGKTEVARILHRLLYPDCKEIKINFGNYSGKGSLWSLIGSPKGYLGSEQGGELTNKIKNSKSKIILIDEFEKADDSIFTFFYEMLEDGKYTDLDENEVDLDGYIIIFTANLSSENYRNKIPEPLFSRFDMTYEFSRLTFKDKLDFVSTTVSSLINDYKKLENIRYDDKMEEELLSLEVNNIDNLRDLKRLVMVKFIDIIER